MEITDLCHHLSMSMSVSLDRNIKYCIWKVKNTFSSQRHSIGMDLIKDESRGGDKKKWILEEKVDSSGKERG